MENVQRSVMLLKPDGHVPGRWEGGATLKLNTIPGGIALSYQGQAALVGDCELTLFLRDGSQIEAGRVGGASLEAKISGVRLSDVAGAAVIRQSEFIQKSSGLNWPDIAARYRFAHAQQSAPADTLQYEPENEIAPTQAPMVSQMADDPRQTPEVSQMTDAPPQAPEVPPITEAPPQDADKESGILPAESPVPPDADETPDACPQSLRQSRIDPFPGVFPGSEWAKISYPGPNGWWHYIFGRTVVDGSDADVIGVPGDYSMAPPAWLDGFSTYVRCTSGDARGYWLMFQDAQTGRVLGTGRFRHGG